MGRVTLAHSQRSREKSGRWRAGGGGLRPDPGPGQDGTGGPVTQLPSAVRSHPEHSGWRRRRDAEQEPWHPIPACGSPPSCPPTPPSTARCLPGHGARTPARSFSGSRRSGFFVEMTARGPTRQDPARSSSCRPVVTADAPATEGWPSSSGPGQRLLLPISCFAPLVAVHSPFWGPSHCTFSPVCRSCRRPSKAAEVQNAGERRSLRGWL